MGLAARFPNDGEHQDAKAGPGVSTTDLAQIRTLQATERTLMAWVRTAISMISFGFTMVKFFAYLGLERKVEFNLLGPGGVGMILIAGGILALIAGIHQYRVTVRQIEQYSKQAVLWKTAVYIAYATCFIGILAFAGVVRGY